MMSGTAVVYATRSGSTKRYAEWIAESCGGDLFSIGQTNIDELAKYETLIYGGCVYGGLIQGISLIKNHRELLKTTRLFVFAVGLTPPGDDAAFERVLNRNFAPEERKGIRFYHFMGAVDYQRLSLLQRPMLYVLKKNIQSKVPEARSQVEQHLLDAYGGRVDFTNRAYVEPLLQALLDGTVGTLC